MAKDGLQPALVDVEAAARYLGLGRTKLLEYAYAEKIRSLKVGARRLFLVTDLDRWAEQQVAAQGDTPAAA